MEEVPMRGNLENIITHFITLRKLNETITLLNRC
jgi:hypothetical protein